MVADYKMKVERIPREKVVYMRRTGAYGIGNYTR